MRCLVLYALLGALLIGISTSRPVEITPIEEEESVNVDGVEVSDPIKIFIV